MQALLWTHSFVYGFSHSKYNIQCFISFLREMGLKSILIRRESDTQVVMTICQIRSDNNVVRLIVAQHE